MLDTSAPVEIPNRALFKAAEVCDIVKVQPYVLRTWEAEFPDLGVSKTAGAPRVYRRADVEQVVRIKQLLLVEGLTLAGARRKMEEDSAPVAADAPAIEELIGRNARERLTSIKRGLRGLLDLLSRSHDDERRVAAALVEPVRRARPLAVSRTKPARAKAAPRRRPSRDGRARRKRSA